MFLACGAIIVYELLIFRASTVSKLTTIAEIIGTSTTPAVFFKDPIYAEEVLQILKVESHITAALIFEGDGALFASSNQNPMQKDFSIR